MKVLLQVVKKASVTIDGKLYSSINNGFLLFVGFTNTDDEQICEKMVKKISKLRVFPDSNGKTNLSLNDVNGEILSVSQFTLYASLNGGNRPSFIDAMKGDESIKLYQYFNKLLKQENFIVKEGIFGANMKVDLINDGPFTLILDSEELFK